MTRNKKWIIAAVVILVIGILICGATFVASGFDFGILGSAKYETNTYDVNEEFQDISIHTDVDKIVFEKSEDSRCRVVCNETEDIKHDVQVKDETLSISVQDNREWYEFFSIGIREPGVTVYLPAAQYNRLTVDSGTGNVTIPEDFSFEDIEITLSTGDVTCSASAEKNISITSGTGDIRCFGIRAVQIYLEVTTGHINASSVNCDGIFDVHVSAGKAELTDIKCGDMRSIGSTGDLILKNVMASGELDVRRSTGDIRFEGCDAGSIYAKTSTGGVTGTLLSDKVFITDTGTGDVDVPKTVQGGKCEITTSTGDIRIQIR